MSGISRIIIVSLIFTLILCLSYFFFMRKSKSDKRDLFRKITNEVREEGKNEEREIPYDADVSKVLMEVYSIDEREINVYFEPQLAPQFTIYRRPYLYCFKVVGELKNWFIVQSENSKYKQLYVPKSDVVDENLVPFTNYDLNHIFSFSQTDSVGDELELISKTEYDSMKPNAVSYISYDKFGVKEIEKGVILKFKNKQDTFLNDSSHSFRYAGDIKFLNAYILNKRYEGDYGDDPSEDTTFPQSHFLINKTTGKKIKEYISMPYISKNKDLVLNFNEYVFLNGYSIVLFNWNQTKALFSNFYDKWIPIDNQMFWGSDNNFYMIVLPRFVISDSYGEKYERKLTSKSHLYRYVKFTPPPQSKFSEISPLEDYSNY